MSELRYRVMSLLEPSIWIFVATVVLSFDSSVTRARESVHHDAQETITAGQWETLDIRFGVASVPDQPVDIEFSATFTDQSGNTVAVAGFYDGDSEYVIRFTPPTGQAHWRPMVPEILRDKAGYQTLAVGKLGIRAQHFSTKGGSAPPLYQTNLGYRNRNESSCPSQQFRT